MKGRTKLQCCWCTNHHRAMKKLYTGLGKGAWAVTQCDRPAPTHSLVLRLKLLEVQLVELHEAALNVILAKRPYEVKDGRREVRLLGVLQYR